MPSIKDDSTVEAIAREFTSNGRNAELALKAVGYTDNYAEHRSKCVLSNVVVKQAIASIDARNSEKNEWTVERSQQLLLESRAHAVGLRQPSAEISAVIAINRLYGMDKDAGISGKDMPKPITASDLALLRSMARAITDRELAQPVLDVAVEAQTEPEAIDRGKDEQ